MDAKGGPGSLPHPKPVLSMIAFDGTPWTSVYSPRGVCTQHMGNICVVLGTNQIIHVVQPPVPSAEVTNAEMGTRTTSRMQLLHISEQNPGEY